MDKGDKLIILPSASYWHSHIEMTYEQTDTRVAIIPTSLYIIYCEGFADVQPLYASISWE